MYFFFSFQKHLSRACSQYPPESSVRCRRNLRFSQKLFCFPGYHQAEAISEHSFPSAAAASRPRLHGRPAQGITEHIHLTELTRKLSSSRKLATAHLHRPEQPRAARSPVSRRPALPLLQCAEALVAATWVCHPHPLHPGSVLQA